MRLDAASDVGEIEPDFDAQKWEPSVQMGVAIPARRWQGGPTYLREFRVDARSSATFVHGGGVNFFLGIEAGAHGPFVEKVEE